MTRTLRTHHDASDELTATVAWYEAQEFGLGADFFDEVSHVIERVIVHPEIGAPFSRDKTTRRLVLSRFPYQLIYQLMPGVIVIVAVAHLKRRPGYWKHRVSP